MSRGQHQPLCLALVCLIVAGGSCSGTSPLVVDGLTAAGEGGSDSRRDGGGDIAGAEAGLPQLPPSPCRVIGASPGGVQVTDPSARWERAGVFAGLGFQGYLDGPRLEMRSYAPPTQTVFFEVGGDYVLRGYDAKTERYVTIAGGARGYLDGPFSRARFGGWGYGGGLGAACGSDGALYIVESGPKVLRRVDFDKRVVTTVLKDIGSIAISAGSDGKLYLAGWDGIIVTTLEGQVLQKWKPVGQSPGHGFSIAIDEKHQRLYAANRCIPDWYVWYWDLTAGAKFVGVLPFPKAGDPVREQNLAGPFDGADLHCPGGLAFGPDDPALEVRRKTPITSQACSGKPAGNAPGAREKM
jgi:hypothetical protein